MAVLSSRPIGGGDDTPLPLPTPNPAPGAGYTGTPIASPVVTGPAPVVGYPTVPSTGPTGVTETSPTYSGPAGSDGNSSASGSVTVNPPPTNVASPVAWAFNRSQGALNVRNGRGPVTNQSGLPGSSTTTTTTAAPQDSTAADDTLASLLGALAGNDTSGIGAGDTSLPPPSAADVAALQPTTGSTSSSGPNVVLIIGLVAAIGFAIYWFAFRKKKGGIHHE